MSWERPPVGARVRVVDVLEGVVTEHLGTEGFYLDEHVAVRPFESGEWVRSVAVLELPRPDEPTGVNAVVLARHTLWEPGWDRSVWARAASGLWATSDRGAFAWVDLKDITVLHPGGVE